MALEKWDFDPVHSSVGFRVRHMVVSKVTGHFNKWSGELEFDEQNPAASKVRARIDAASLDTRDEKRDAHLRSADFFDVEKYPELVFESTRIEGKGEELKLVGNLTIRGVTREVTLDVDYSGRAKDPWGGERAGFSAKGSIDRKDYGLNWNVALEAGGILVGEKVELLLEIEVVRQPGA